MGLDVYVGTLTRYYAGQWETVVQQYAREQGLSLRVERQNDPVDAVTDPAEIEPAVVAWRSDLGRALVPHGVLELSWPEGLGPPYFTDKPAWDCYTALVLWAAHDEHPGHARPLVAPDGWDTDPAFLAATTEGIESRYAQLLLGVELWLPAAFGFTFEADDLTGQRVRIGSVPTLLAQLRDLNARSWRAEQGLLAEWRHRGAEKGATLEHAAQFAFAVFWELASSAVDAGLPMKLDY